MCSYFNRDLPEGVIIMSTYDHLPVPLLNIL